MSIADDPAVASLITLAKAEDFGDGDVTACLLADGDAPARFRLVVRSAGVLAGVEIAAVVLHAYDPAIRIDWLEAGRDGAVIQDPPTDVADITGPLGSILAAERVLLNFLQRLSGVATLTRSYVDAVAGTRARIFDTRKTTPGWRGLEKYAVRCGGGCNHRLGLHDAVLIKDNHLAGVPAPRLAATVFEMLNRLEAAAGWHAAPRRDPQVPPSRPAFVEVEADDLAQVEQLLKVVGIDVVLLDNFSFGDLAAAVRLRDGLGLAGQVELEASGGITLETVRAVAETGVERISVGALTHSARALDLALERIMA